MIWITISNATLILGAHTILRDLNWEVQHDQKIGLIGPNGAGKSSLLKLIIGEHAPDTELMMAGSVLTILPVMLVFLFLQRYYIQGVMAGSVKG